MIITVTNQKGGVGKTTTAVALATAANQPDRYLLADLDPQGHCAIALGLDPAPHLYHTLTRPRPVVLPLDDLPRCALLRGNSYTKRLTPHFSIDAANLRWLADNANRHVVFDTAAQGALQEAAITVADHIVIPTRLDFLAVDGVNATVALIHQLNPGAPYTILPVHVDRRLREHNIILELLAEHYPPPIIGPRVPARVAVAEAIAAGQTIWDYPSPRLNDVRAAYRRLLLDILPHEYRTGDLETGDLEP